MSSNLFEWEGILFGQNIASYIGEIVFTGIVALNFFSQL